MIATGFYYLLRLVFVVLFGLTALGKLLDNRGFAQIIETYQIPGLTGQMVLYFSLGFSLFELSLAIGMWSGCRLRLCAACGFLLHVMYTVLAATTLNRGLILDNCGCFGVFWARPLTSITVVEDSILSILSLIFLVLVIRQQKSNMKTPFSEAFANLT